MARSVILSNGRLAVGLNERGLVHDFYYPYVGLDNLTTARSVHHKIGVWRDGHFSWTDEPVWECKVDFGPDALITNIEMVNQDLGISLQFQDFVDHEFDAFCRIITVKNLHGEPANVRLFMHQVFEISRAGRGDTALMVPDVNYILDYKGRCCLLVSGRHAGAEQAFDQFAIGNYGIEGKQGTFKDAEDGELSGNTVEHGGVDSVIRFSFELEANGEQKLDYWIAAADSQYNGEIIHSELARGLEQRLISNQRHWQEWLQTGIERLDTIPPEYRDMAKKSLLVIKAHTDARGGIIASCDSSIYNFGRDYYSYVWPRDGAYAMWPLIRLGYREEPKNFFKFCNDILTSTGYLMHKYQPDRAIGSTWHPLLHGKRRELAIQEDETALVIVMLGEYYTYSKDAEFVRGMFDSLVRPAADFIGTFVDPQTSLPHASYDLWEEKFLTSTYTVSVVYRALQVASDLANEFGTNEQAERWKYDADRIVAAAQVFDNPDGPGYRKGYLLSEDGSLQFDNTMDLSSVYGVMTFHYQTEPDHGRIAAAIAEIEQTLADQSPSGGSPRYASDNYFRTNEDFLGNPWIISTLWLAQYHIRVGELDKARQRIDWTVSTALPSGALPEQVDPVTKKPLSVTPLVWSHAEFINTALDIARVTKHYKHES
jgi:GH15 family glucan-1,4-alpha-glucosidase